jgi:hypothetical protein
MMKFFQLAALSGFALILPVAATHAAAAGACQASLGQVTAQWDAIGFATPMKPMQPRIAARDGRVASGAEVTYLANQLRLAARDCTAGREESGSERLSLVGARLTALR